MEVKNMRKRGWLTLTIICSCVGFVAVGGGIGIGYAIWHNSSQDRYDYIVDDTIHFNELDSWDYQKHTSSHKAADFSSLSTQDAKILNYFNDNFHADDLLNTFVYYTDQIINTTTVNDNQAPLSSALNMNESKLHVLYIEHNEQIKGFATYIMMDLDISQSINSIDGYELPSLLQLEPGDSIEINIHSLSERWFSSYSFYNVKEDDPDQQIFKGNNTAMTIPSHDGDNFWVFGEIEHDGVDYTTPAFNKHNWSNLPIVGFTDVILPTLEN